MQKFINFITSRVFVVGFLLFIQIAIIVLIFLFLSWLFIPILVLFIISNLIIVIAILNKNSNTMFKVAWIIPVLCMPITGAVFYLMFGRTHLNKKNTDKLTKTLDSSNALTEFDEESFSKFSEKHGHSTKEARYIVSAARTNIYRFTETEYLCPGEVFFEKLLYELKKAKSFIFLEYFIVEEGKMWSAIQDVLVSKINHGVDVWLMFDDIGSIMKLPDEFPTSLRKLGFKVAVFNPFKPSIDKFLNYRDHRKFTIIDGKTAFTGGINIADEYIGEVKRFGDWEDSAILIRGDAVNRITIMFLQLWYFSTGELPNYEKYQVKFEANHDGYVIPFADEPLIRDLVSENAYINMIDRASDYVYISTPYLIIDDVMTSSLIRAAKSGVDVRIMTPHIPDKKIVFYMTQSNYEILIQNGVKIFEFKPGFMHTKSIVSDDKKAIVGTANFDYRSFYLHFENGVWLYGTKSVMEVKNSFLLAQSKSLEIDQKYIDKIPFIRKLISSVLKVFAPLM